MCDHVDGLDAGVDASNSKSTVAATDAGPTNLAAEVVVATGRTSAVVVASKAVTVEGATTEATVNTTTRAAARRSKLSPVKPPTPSATRPPTGQRTPPNGQRTTPSGQRTPPMKEPPATPNHDTTSQLRPMPDLRNIMPKDFQAVLGTSFRLTSTNGFSAPQSPWTKRKFAAG